MYVLARVCWRGDELHKEMYLSETNSLPVTLPLWSAVWNSSDAGNE